jgi:pimeloyl-ACP methyl ester carboxylesterase
LDNQHIEEGVSRLLHYRKYYINEMTPWVTLIHGAGANSSMWYKQIREYTKYFNVLLIDLRGHGKSARNQWRKGDTFVQIADEVIEVLDHLRIEKTHFVGISLGTIVIQTIAQKQPERILSMVLGGAVTRLDFRTNLLCKIGNMSKYFLPYMWIYKLFAWIIMPKKNNKEARQVFIEQAKMMSRKEFIKWFSLTKRLNPFLSKLQKNFFGIPTLFVMGEEDYMFLESVHRVILSGFDAHIAYIENAGHVCNIDQPLQFNRVTIDFMLKNSHLILPLKL